MKIFGRSQDKLLFDIDSYDTKTVTLRNKFVMKMQKVGKVVFFQLETTSDTYPMNPPSIGVLPSGWIPKEEIIVSVAEFVYWGGQIVMANNSGVARIDTSGVVWIGYGNKDSQLRKTSGSYVVA